MKKQKKQFVGMLLVLAVLAAAYGGIHVYNQKQEKKEASEEEAEKLTVVDFKTDDVTAFSYVLGGQVYAYTKTDGEWTWGRGYFAHPRHVTDRRHAGCGHGSYGGE